MSPSETSASAPAPLPLSAVLVTQRLSTRAPRPPDPAAENRALHAVARAMNASARAALDALMAEALTLCRPDGNATTGVSLLERDSTEDVARFRWTAMAGRLAHCLGGSTPRDFSPCGVCLDELRPVLFERPDLRFTYFLDTGLPFIEGLVLPFHVGGEPAGTIWIVSHDDTRLFDAEDVRLMTSLADFTGTVYTLLRAREAADAARDDREQLLQTVSHEWRTPLGAITGMTALLQDGVAGPVSEEQRALLRRTRGAADHLLALVNETLAASRPGAAAEAPHVERLELDRLVSETAAMVEPAARAARLSFDVQVAAAPTFVLADATRVRQVLLNLLGNAVKFTRRGGVTIRVEAPRDGLVAIVVRDTGIGIALEDAARVFERYWRVAPASGADDGDQPDGTGLGLAISRDLARGMGGDLTVESRVDEGSTFTLTLPAA